MAWYKHTPTDLAWFWRGTQSAIFYYVACTPCFVRAAKKKQKKENKRAMAQRGEQMQLAEGMFYDQPLPFQTNEAWRSEIELGPGRPSVDDGGCPGGDNNVEAAKATHSRTSSPSRPSSGNPTDDKQRPEGIRRVTGTSTRSTTRLEAQSSLSTLFKSKSKARSDAAKDRRLATPDPTGKAESTSTSTLHKTNTETHGTPNTAVSRSQLSARASSSGGTTLGVEGYEHPGDGGSVTSCEGSSGRKRRYQRPLEPLWGITDGFGPLEKLQGYVEPEPVPSWYVKRNPEVNDLHPPVVSSLPKNKKEALWMLQPPPPAAFMEGRTAERQTRSRAATDATTSTSSSTHGANRAKRYASTSSPAGSDTADPKPRRKRRPPPLKTIVSDNV